MEAFKAFFSNDSNLFYFCSAWMVVYQLILYKGKKFYNFSKEMEKHVLNRKYALNKSCSADLEQINRLYGLANIAAILSGCIAVTLCGFKTGLLLLAVLFVLLNQIVTVHLGKRYGR